MLFSLTSAGTTTVLSSGRASPSACLVVAGLLRFRFAYWLGWALQVAAIATGVLVPAMFFLGTVFLALWATAYLLGHRIEVERAEWERTGNYPAHRRRAERRGPVQRTRGASLPPPAHWAPPTAFAVACARVWEAAGLAEPALDLVEQDSSPASRSVGGTSCRGPSRCRTAYPCTAAQQSTSATSRRPWPSAPAASSSSRDRPSRP